MKQYRVGDLFAGVGGISLGFLQAKQIDAEYRISWANEIDPFACATYRTNFSHPLLEGDIRQILHPKQSKYYKKLHKQMLTEPMDILTGGFPCQAFSIAGKQMGLNDERGNLFLCIIDLIHQLDEKFRQKPRILFLENVKHLQTHDQGKTYQVIKQAFEESGYIIKEMVLNTMLYSDLPQNRERMYIIGFLNQDDAKLFTMDEHLMLFQKHKTKEEREGNIKKILDNSVDDPFYFYTKKRYPLYFESEDEFATRHGGQNKTKVRINLAETMTKQNQFYQLRRGQQVRKNQSGVCPTLTANMGTGGHNVPLILTPKGIRKITPTEAFKLQGFPIGNGYELPTRVQNRAYGRHHLYQQAGNSVSVPVITMIANELLKVLVKVDTKKDEEKIE